MPDEIALHDPHDTRIESRARWAFAALLLMGGLAGAGWYAVESGRYATYEIDTHDSVSGLMADAPVEFHGVDVGKVARVDLVGPASVSVLLHVRKDAPVTAGTVATITSRGLASKGFTGYVYVSLDDDGTDPGPPPAQPDTPYRRIRIASSRSVNVDTAISQVNDNVRAMTKLLQASLDDKTVVSLKQTLDSLQKVSRTLADEKTVASVRQTLDSLQKVTRSLADNSERMNAIVQNAERASNRLEPLLDSGSDTAKALQTQVLPQAYEALENLDRLSTSLRSMTARIDQDPSILIRGAAKRTPGPGESR